MINTQIFIDILNNVHSAVYVVDENGIIQYINHAVELMDHVKASEVIGKSVLEAYGNNQFDEDRESPTIVALRDGIYPTDANLEWKSSGKIVHALTSVQPIMKDGIRQGVIVIADDYDMMKKRIISNMEFADKKVYSAQIVALKNGTRYVFSDIIGKSSVMWNTIETAKKFAARNMAIMIYGETGTGKEMFAQSIHNASSCYNGPFVAVNCAAIPENLLESTLFGVKKGAFTGSSDAIGLFEKAENGTIFLDEINSLPLSMQAKLLRALQEKEIQRVGDSVTRKINCRVISATNDMPNLLIVRGKLREDLYYRLSAGYVIIPPLRSRGEDIDLIIQDAIDRLNKEYGMFIIGLTPQLSKLVHEYSWPGNVRELIAMLEKAFNLASDFDGYLGLEHLMTYERQKMEADAEKNLKGKNVSNKVNADYTTELYIVNNINQMVDEYEKGIIEKALTQCEGNLSKSSEILGISKQSLHVKMKKYSLKKEVFKPDYVPEDYRKNNRNF